MNTLRFSFINPNLFGMLGVVLLCIALLLTAGGLTLPDDNPVYQENQRAVSTGDFPPGWKPPGKDHCGEDMVRYFALMYLQEVFANFIIDSSTHGLLDPAVYENSPLFKDAQKLTDEWNQTSARLREKDCYFYGRGQKSGDGSVFMDYKMMRSHFYKNAFKGNYLKVFRTAITLETTSEQALEWCAKQVVRWWPK